VGNIIDRNVAFYFGGGLSIGGGLSVVSGNLFYGNSAGPGSACAGGGIACGDSVILSNNTIVGNFSNYIGGGIRCGTAAGPLMYANNIVWGNVAWRDSQISIWDQSQPIAFVYSDIQGGWPGVGNIDLDPLFRDTANGDFRLMATACGDLFDSPGIDAGDPAIFDDSLACAWGLGTMRSDMGAYGGGRANPDAVENDGPAIPGNFILLQNYPNPFNSSTTISFSLTEPGDATLEIFDILGRKVETLHEGWLRAGSYKVTWDATDAPSGIYFMRMTAGGREFTRSAVLLK
jgi:hypothetical protein